MEKIQRILCAIDGSEGSFFGAEQARSISKRFGAEVLYLYVIPTELAVIPGPPLQPEVRRGLLESAEETLGQLAKISERESVESRGHIIEGDPAESIINSAARSNSDLIVVSARGSTAIGRWLLGSTTAKILQHAPVPVLVARGDGPFKGFDRILCGVDGSSESEYAAYSAMAFAKAYEGEIRLCHVSSISEEILPQLSDEQRFIEEKAKGWVESEMDRICDETGATGSSCSRVFLDGNPADRILEEASEWRANLIAMGSRGLGTFSRLTLGSSSHRVSEYADCSVLVLRRPAH